MSEYTFNMSTSVTFDKDIIKLVNPGDVSAGGFIFRFGNNDISFDFRTEDFCLYNDDTICFDLRVAIDTETEEPIKISFDTLKSVSKIVDFFVFTGEDSGIAIKNINSIHLEMLADDGVLDFDIPNEIIKEYLEARDKN